MLWRRNQIVLSSAVVRTAAFQAVGCFTEDRVLDPVADYHLWLRPAHDGWKTASVPERLFHYHLTLGCLTGQVRRFADAELTCARQLGARLGLSERAVSEKVRVLLDGYGRKALNQRDMPTARTLLAQVLQAPPTPLRVFWLLASWAPVGLLDI